MWGPADLIERCSFLNCHVRMLFVYFSLNYFVFADLIERCSFLNCHVRMLFV